MIRARHARVRDETDPETSAVRAARRSSTSQTSRDRGAPVEAERIRPSRSIARRMQRAVVVLPRPIHRRVPASPLVDLNVTSSTARTCPPRDAGSHRDRKTSSVLHSGSSNRIVRSGPRDRRWAALRRSSHDFGCRDDGVALDRRVQGECTRCPGDERVRDDDGRGPRSPRCSAGGTRPLGRANDSGSAGDRRRRTRAWLVTRGSSAAARGVRMLRRVEEVVHGAVLDHLPRYMIATSSASRHDAEVVSDEHDRHAVLALELDGAVPDLRLRRPSAPSWLSAMEQAGRRRAPSRHGA